MSTWARGTEPSPSPPPLFPLPFRAALPRHAPGSTAFAPSRRSSPAGRKQCPARSIPCLASCSTADRTLGPYSGSPGAGASGATVPVLLCYCPRPWLGCGVTLCVPSAPTWCMLLADGTPSMPAPGEAVARPATSSTACYDWIFSWPPSSPACSALAILSPTARPRPGPLTLARAPYGSRRSASIASLDPPNACRRRAVADALRPTRAHSPSNSAPDERARHRALASRAMRSLIPRTRARAA